MRITAALIAIACVVGGCRATAPPAPVPRAVASTKQLMEAIVDPAADGIWGPVGTIMTLSGTTELVPANDDEWAAVQHSALALAESGNLLLMPSRSGGNDEWITLSRQLTDLGEKASKAAEAKDPKAIFDLGAEIYDVCTACHRQFNQTQQPAAK